MAEKVDEMSPDELATSLDNFEMFKGQVEVLKLQIEGLVGEVRYTDTKLKEVKNSTESEMMEM